MRGLDYLSTVGPVRVHGLADYSWGESQVLQMVQYFNALGRPSQFEAAVEAIYASYEKLRTSFATLAATVRDDGMKQVGQQAQAMTSQLAAYAASKQTAAATTPGGVASPASPAPPPPPALPPPPSSGPLGLPTWAWWAGGAAVAALALGPIVAPLIAARAVRR
jgi:hypothetical protein